MHFPKKKFFTKGLLTVPESRVLKIGSQNYQVPIVWATSLINNASKNGRIRSNMDKDMLIRVCGFVGQI